MGKVKSHRKEIESLKTKDPEFYKFLQENDTQTLNFGNQEDGDDEDEDEEEENSDDEGDDGLDDEEGDEFEVIDDDGEDYGDDEEVDEEVNTILTNRKEKKQKDKKKNNSSNNKDNDIHDNNNNDDDDDNFDDNKKQSKVKKNKTSSSSSSGLIEITTEMLDITVQKATSLSSNGTSPLASLKKLLAFFRAACIPNTGNDDNEDDDDDDDDDDKDRHSSSDHSKNKYTVASPEVYNDIMIKVLENAHISFRLLFQCNRTNNNDNNNDEKEEEEEYDYNHMDSHPKWKRYQPLILTFFKSLLHTLSTFQYLTNSNAAQSGPIGTFLISSLSDYLFLLPCLPRLARTVLKLLLLIWSQDLLMSDDVSKIRECSFLRIFQMAKNLPGIIVEDVYKQIYLIYAKKCKIYNEMNSTSILFMSECIIQLYSLNIEQAYQQAFLYIRQLALHLRTTILKKNNAENSKVLYSWQYLNCLKLWTKLLYSLPAQDQLGALVFPLSQIILGFISTIQSVYYLPLKFHLISCLHQLASASESFIPTAAKLYDLFELTDLQTKSTPSTQLAPDLNFSIKLPANSINTQIVKDFVIQETIHLLQMESEIYKYHVGYPEYVFTIIKKLKNFSKIMNNNKYHKQKQQFGNKNKNNNNKKNNKNAHVENSKWKELIKVLISQLEDQSVYVKTHRLLLKQSPVDIVDFEPLRPHGTAKAVTRVGKMMNARFNHQLSITRMNNSKKNNNNQKSQNGKRKYDDDDDDDDEEEEEEDDDDDDDVRNKKNKKQKVLLNTKTTTSSTSSTTSKSNEKNNKTKNKDKKKKAAPSSSSSSSSSSAMTNGQTQDEVGEFSGSWFDDDNDE